MINCFSGATDVTSPMTVFFILTFVLLQVTIKPAVISKSVNRAIIAQLVRVHRESDLGMRLPAYDGRNSLYTAGELPFTSREFTVKLSVEDDASIPNSKY